MPLSGSALQHHRWCSSPPGDRLEGGGKVGGGQAKRVSPAPWTLSSGDRSLQEETDWDRTPAHRQHRAGGVMQESVQGLFALGSGGARQAGVPHPILLRAGIWVGC